LLRTNVRQQLYPKRKKTAKKDIFAKKKERYTEPAYLPPKYANFIEQ